MKRKLKKFLALGPGDQWMLFKLWILLPLVGLGLRVLGYGRCARLLSSTLRKGSRGLVCEAESIAIAESLAVLVRIASGNGVHAASCLDQSLALWWLLRRRGVKAAIKLGGRLSDGQLQAHAWVVCHGIKLDENREVERDFSFLGEL